MGERHRTLHPCKIPNIKSIKIVGQKRKKTSKSTCITMIDIVTFMIIIILKKEHGMSFILHIGVRFHINIIYHILAPMPLLKYHYKLLRLSKGYV